MLIEIILLLSFLIGKISNDLICNSSPTNLSANCVVDGNCLCSRQLNKAIKIELNLTVEMINKQESRVQLMEDEIIADLEKIMDKRTSPTCPKYYPINCDEVEANGNKKSDLHMIYPTVSLTPFYVYCDMDAVHGHYWTVAFKRFDGSQNFELGWSAYKDGFGDYNGEFWLGLQRLHELTNDENCIVRVPSSISEPFIETVKIGSESEEYMFFIGQGTETSGIANGTKFCTLDRRHEGSCKMAGGWWFNCTKNLNNPMGKFYNDGRRQGTINETMIFVTDNTELELFTPSRVGLAIKPFSKEKMTRWFLRKGRFVKLK